MSFCKPATTEAYTLPVFSLLTQAWRNVKGIKKPFWGGFALLFLIMLGVYVVVELVLILTGFSHQSSLTAFINFIAAGIVSIIRLLLSVSLIYLALTHLRQQGAHALQAFEFRKQWQSLVLLGLILYLLNVLFIGGINLLSQHMAWMTQPLAGYSKFTFNLILRFIVFVFLFTYITLWATMSALLILDQECRLNQSVKKAFHGINQHIFKNIGLMLMGTFIFLLGGLITLGIGLIWLFPFLSLVSAVQYQQIFSLNNNKVV